MNGHLRGSLFRTYKIALTVLGGLLVLSITANIVTSALAWTAYKRGRLVVTPMVYNEKFSVSQSAIDPAYVRQMGLSFLFLFLNVTPDNVNKNHQLLMSYTSPLIRSSMQKMLASESKTIRENDVSSVFYPDSIDVRPGTGLLDVWGILKLSAGETALKPERKHYRMKLHLKGGRPEIMSFKEGGDNEH